MTKDSDREDLRRSQPHFAESLRLKEEIKLLKEQLKKEHRLSARLEIKRRMSFAKTSLTRELIYKRLHGEGKKSIVSKVRSAIEPWMKRVQRWGAKLEDRSERIERKLQFSLRINIPPSVFSLSSLYTSEKGSDTKEWVKNRQSRARKLHKRPSSTIETHVHQKEPQGKISSS